MFKVSKEFKIEKQFKGRFIHKLVYFLSNFKSDVYIEKNERTVNAKSIIGLLSLDIKQNDIVVIKVFNSYSEEIANDNLSSILSFLNNEDNL